MGLDYKEQIGCLGVFSSANWLHQDAFDRYMSRQKAMEKSYYNKTMKRTKVYYCHPYNACERGSNENANKLIRRWIPKGAHISDFTDQYIKDIEEWINNYPRKLFNYLSSKEYKSLKVIM